jgi:N-methylhydantoinase A
VVETRKVLTTPHDQSEGVEAALRALGRATIARIVHGTTVATNTLLERSGATVVLCTTDGFTDVLRLARQDRASLYDLSAHHPPPLVDPDNVIAVRERIDPDGVQLPLTDTEALRAAREVAARAPDVVAICLLHAYSDPRHEHLLRDAIACVAPDLDVVLSSDVFPEIREYERTATTVAEGYLRPGVAQYIQRLAGRLRDAGFPAPGVMTSSGGMRTADDAAHNAAQLALSGPAGGVVGAAMIARAAGVARVLSIDIGGTSADVGLVLDGEPLTENGGAVAGVPISLPRVLVETVSAGGGSIAWIDDGGALRVGPRSAGAIPGPAAFGRGGTHPTVTDAHVVLGTIHSRRLSGGIAVDTGAARAAIAPLARSLGASVERVADAIVATADATMARALRRVSVERGIDPRECVLVAFGGGGPLHACGLAERIGATRVLVPPHAGVLSALGLAVTAERREAISSVMRSLESMDPEELDASLRVVAARVDAPDHWNRGFWFRARYAGQGHELDVAVSTGETTAAVRARFAELHAGRFGFTLERDVELVSVRHAVTGPAQPVVLERRGPTSWRDDDMDDNGGELTATVAGPASIRLPDATLFLRPGWRATTLPIGGWLAERIS